MNKRSIVISSIVLAIILMAGVLYHQYTSSPEYSLTQIKIAYQEHDITNFEKYVDVKSIANGVLNQFMDEFKSDGSATETEKLGTDLAKGLVNILRPQIEDIWKQQINRLIETGEIEKESERHDFRDYWIRTKGVRFERIVSALKEGKVCNVQIELFQPRFDTTLLLDLKLRDKGNYWQLFDLPNVKSYMMKLDSLENARVQILNQNIRDLISKAFQIENINLKVVSQGSYYVSRYLYYSIDFSNNGHKPIKDVDLTYHVIDGKGTYLDHFSIRKEIALLPNEKYTYKNYKYLVNSNIDIHKALVTLDIGNITFDDGEKLKWHTPWENI